MKLEADERSFSTPLSARTGDLRAPKRVLSRVQSLCQGDLQKDRRLNIRISTKDLEAIQKRALEEGLPYQTLMASLLHKYASGRLRETQRVMRLARGRSDACPTLVPGASLAAVADDCTLVRIATLTRVTTADHLARRMFDHTCGTHACGDWRLWPQYLARSLARFAPPFVDAAYPLTITSHDAPTAPIRRRFVTGPNSRFRSSILGSASVDFSSPG